MSVRRKRVSLIAMFCSKCLRRWGSTQPLRCRERGCPFCGSPDVTWVKR